MGTQETKTKSPAAPRKSGLVKSLLTVAVSVVIAAVLFLNLFTHVLPVVRYHGAGMEPSLTGGHLLVFLKTQKVEQGDIIAFYYNNSIIVRRVIAVGGSQVSVQNDGTVLIDGAELSEPYLSERSIGQNNQSYPLYIQPGSVFVMGDNRAVVMDSRLSEIGPISEERILGRLLFTLS